MLTEADVYEILGVAPDAGAEDLMRAYRKAVLRYHPDRCPGNPTADATFHRITQVYRAAMNFRRKGIDGHKFTPQELAMKNWTEPCSGFVTAKPESDMSWLIRLGGRRLSLPTVNENLLFVYLWAVAMVITFLAAPLMGEFFLAGRSLESLTALDVVIFAAVSLGVYAASFAAAIIVIILTRQIVYIAAQIRLAAQRALPSGREEAIELPDK